MVLPQLAVVLAEVEESVGVVESIAAKTESLGGPAIESKGEVVPVLLRAEVCHAGVHPPSKDRVAGMQAVAGYVAVRGIGDAGMIVLQIAPEVVVGCGKGIAVYGADDGAIERMDSVAECGSVGIELAVCIEAVREGDGMASLLPRRGRGARRNCHQQDKQ